VFHWEDVEKPQKLKALLPDILTWRQDIIESSLPDLHARKLLRVDFV